MATGLAVQAYDLGPCLLLVLRSSLLACNGALRASDASLELLPEAWVLDRAPVGVREEHRHAPINGDGRLCRGRRVGEFELTHDRREPLVTVARERAGLRLADEGTMNHRADRSELWEDHRSVTTVALDAKLACVVLAQPHFIASSLLEPRCANYALKASVPCFVERIEERHAQVSRHIGQPRKLCAKLRELKSLIERRRIPTIHPAPAVGVEALFVGDVPQEPQRPLPRLQPRHLFGRRVDTIAVSAANDHSPSPRWCRTLAACASTSRSIASAAARATRARCTACRASRVSVSGSMS